MIADLIERLEDSGAGYETVKHAWSLELVDEIVEGLPAAYFVPGPITSEGSPSLPIRQRQVIGIVVITMSDWRERDALLEKLYGAMLGYQHEAGYTELEHVKGEVRKIRGNIVEWMDMFTTERWIGPASLPYPTP